MRLSVLIVLVAGLACSQEKQFVKLCEMNNATTTVSSSACNECIGKTVKAAHDALSEADQKTFLFFENTCPDHFVECAHGGQYSDCACFGRLEAAETEECRKHALALLKIVASCLAPCSIPEPESHEQL